MSTQLEALKNSIREILSEIEKEEEEKIKKEETTTGDIAGYDTPRAFNPDGTHKSGYTKKMASLTGYSAVNENRFHKLRLDQTLTPNQKIGLGIREIRKKIDEIEKFMEWYEFCDRNGLERPPFTANEISKYDSTQIELEFK